MLDFDATDDRVHGHQEGRFFHGYYGDWCFLPLYVFCGEQLLVAYLRPSNLDAARHAWAILKLLIARLREAWPDVQIIFRGDSGFCRWKMLRWCERQAWIMSLAWPKRAPARAAADLAQQALAGHAQSGQKQRLLAGSTTRPAPGIARGGSSPKRSTAPKAATRALSSPASKAKRRRSTTTSTARAARWRTGSRTAARALCRPHLLPWVVGQPAPAPAFLGGLRAPGNHPAHWPAWDGTVQAQVGTIRLKLLKIGTVIVRNTRRIRLLFRAPFPTPVCCASCSPASAPPEAMAVLSPGTKKTTDWGPCLEFTRKPASQAAAPRFEPSAAATTANANRREICRVSASRARRSAAR